MAPNTQVVAAVQGILSAAFIVPQLKPAAAGIVGGIADTNFQARLLTLGVEANPLSQFVASKIAKRLVAVSGCKPNVPRRNPRRGRSKHPAAKIDRRLCSDKRHFADDRQPAIQSTKLAGGSDFRVTESAKMSGRE
jgi:hypothetical protein